VRVCGFVEMHLVVASVISDPVIVIVFYFYSMAEIEHFVNPKNKRHLKFPSVGMQFTAT
jgi:hypothetical protein